MILNCNFYANKSRYAFFGIIFAWLIAMTVTLHSHRKENCKIAVISGKRIASETPMYQQILRSKEKFDTEMMKALRAIESEIAAIESRIESKKGMLSKEELMREISETTVWVNQLKSIIGEIQSKTEQSYLRALESASQKTNHAIAEYIKNHQRNGTVVFLAESLAYAKDAPDITEDVIELISSKNIIIPFETIKVDAHALINEAKEASTMKSSTSQKSKASKEG